EIEMQICRREDVRECAVLTRENRGEKYVVAYMVYEAGTSPSIGELRAWLNNRLPAYMVPSEYEVLENLPKTPNGKTDRNKLAQLDRTTSNRDRDFTPPRTAVEQTLSDIWADVLGVDRVGVLDNFFDVGGHSLAATKVLARIKNAFGLELPLRIVFEMATIEDLALGIEESLTRKIEVLTEAEARGLLEAIS